MSENIKVCQTRKYGVNIDFMNFDNKTLLITGLVIGGLASLYLNQSELAYTIFGGLIGYLSKDSITIKSEDPSVKEVDSEDGSDNEIA